MSRLYTFCWSGAYPSWNGHVNWNNKILPYQIKRRTRPSQHRLRFTDPRALRLMIPLGSHFLCMTKILLYCGLVACWLNLVMDHSSQHYSVGQVCPRIVASPISLGNWELVHMWILKLLDSLFSPHLLFLCPLSGIC